MAILSGQLRTESRVRKDHVSGSVFFREALRSDLREVLRLYAQPDLDDGMVLSLGDAEQVLERIARYPNYKIYVAVSDERIAGTFALLIMDNLGHLGTRSAIIEDVAVDPTLQNRGIGTEMIRYAIQRAAENGCYKAMLSSNARRERAHAFYESLDFERHGYSFRIDVRPSAAANAAKRRG
jgi:GNAT superfamily N-acetyltransferase